MKDLLWKYSFVMILSWCLCPLMAQTELETKTLQLFENPITWLKHFDGHIDGIHESTLCLAFDGINCKGYMNYTSSGSSYLLEGTLQGQKLILLEKYNDQPSGYVHGKLNGDQIQLSCKAVDDHHLYHATFHLRTSAPLKKRENVVLVLDGFLDEQKSKLVLQNNGSGSLLFENGKTEKLYTTLQSDGRIEVENLSAGYKLNLVNTKDKQYEASFLLPGAKLASNLKVNQVGEINVVQEEYINHETKYVIMYPSLSAAFDAELKGLIENWTKEISDHKSTGVNNRFGNFAKVWFEIESYNVEYITGVMHYNSTWNNGLESKSFTFDRSRKEMISLTSFLKGSAKWESAVKEKMLAAKNMNNLEDQDQYKKWMNKAALIEPILCKDGLQFYTESNVIFGQAGTFIPWNSLSPLVISSSKLNKLRKIK